MVFRGPRNLCAGVSFSATGFFCLGNVVRQMESTVSGVAGQSRGACPSSMPCVRSHTGLPPRALSEPLFQPFLYCPFQQLSRRRTRESLVPEFESSALAKQGLGFNFSSM